MGQLFRIAGFISFILMLFLNAFVDLGHKIVIQNTLFKTYDGDAQILLTAIVNALILLPFVLLFTPSGFLADRFPKNRVMRLSAWVAVALTLAITLFYYLGWFWLAFGTTFLLAAQSAIYSPAKYGYIKELVGKESLAAANGWVQATTTTAILAGIFVFSILFEGRLSEATFTTPDQVMTLIAPLGWVLVLCSLAEVFMAYRLPQTHAGNAMPFDWREYRSGRYLRHNLHAAWDNQVIWLSIVGLAVFWSISQVMLAVFPAFAKETLGETNTVVIQGMLACSGVGIILGSIVAGRVSRGHIETALIPIGALGIALTLFLLPGLGSAWAHALNFALLGFLAGLFLVPLNALIQFNAGEDGLGRVLAANNFIQNILMLSFLALTVAAAYLQIGGLALMLTLAVIALFGALYTLYQLPQSLVRFVIARAMSTRYRLNVIGLKNLPAQGGVLMLGNHVSWIDWAMMQMASPRPVRFVMERVIYERWYLRWFLDFFGVVPISRGSSRQAIATVTRLLDAGEVVCIFPEGTLSKNGQLSEFKRGFELSARAASSGVILPFYQRGLWGSRFSYASEKLKTNRRDGRMREVIVAFGPTLPLNASAEQVKQAVFELSVTSWQTYVMGLPTLPVAWLATAKRDPGAVSIIDSIGTSLTNRRLIAAVLLFAGRVRRLAPEPAIGILLPASSAGAIANLAALMAGKTVVNLNYTASAEALRAGVAQAGIRHVITADRFLRKLEQRGIDLGATLPDVTLHPMEGLRAGIGKLSALAMLGLSSLLPARALLWLFCSQTKPDDTAAILFSSGSEGTPKGIELTHRNIMANVRQISDVLNTESSDVIMANLPLFHAFGLTATTFLPLLEGIPMVCHPDPTDAPGTAKAIARHRATVLCSTSTFLRLYTRNKRVHPLMLQSLRIVVAGAERLGPEVREAFALKFHKPIYEGYGATETTPVASVNVPDALETETWKIQSGSRPGTVGMPLPGTSFRIVDPVSLETLPAGEDGLILIGGVQVMKGYLKAPEKTAEAVVELDGMRWYKTGDKGHLDSDGFLTIVDRYSRFAKLGGEMISLSAVEEQAKQALGQPELEVAAVNLPDERKGERILLLVAGEIDGNVLRRKLLESGANPLSIPAQIARVEAIPKLGSGKTDVGAARRLALAL
ncbi:acyl-[ACP]--phospholipid O-acyltransferase [Thiocystis violascens]|uniref:Acyl-CoA synthetase (AMP-forming)/AMP-acid ligase II n=1 Tax=Thiocystis violascens (strain ATCC 17096 / DSM 198 / 6111) TaxID=765911 RepID=I3YEQ5_THIV6|nr:acyl-[ACP]--phospholipid O-acyltransferase [Thiocystis violascens]AFL75473.1 acyl-CoA synthetase (AMP-forming)/AMP-acid ligase II [Thiocystis violascens DSM 198]